MNKNFSNIFYQFILLILLYDYFSLISKLITFQFKFHRYKYISISFPESKNQTTLAIQFEE